MIVEVNNVPTKKKMSARDYVRNDIKEAIAKGLKQVEFIDDEHYNYKYLRQTVSEEMDRYTHRLAINEVRRLVREDGRPMEFFTYNMSINRNWYKVTSDKAEDRIHTYMELHMDDWKEDVKEYFDLHVQEAIERHKGISERRAAHEDRSV